MITDPVEHVGGWTPLFMAAAAGHFYGGGYRGSAGESLSVTLIYTIQCAMVP